MIKWGKAIREKLGKAHLSLGGKVTGRKETGHKETGRTETGGKTMGVQETGMNEMGVKKKRAKEIGGKATGGKATGANASVVKTPGEQDSQEMVWKGDMLMGEREMDNVLPGDMTAGQHATGGIRCKSNSEIVIDGVRSRARVFVGDDEVVCFPLAKIEAIKERIEKSWVRAREILF